MAQSQVSGLWPADARAVPAGRRRARVASINNCQAEAEMGSPARGGLPATQARASTAAGASRAPSSGRRRATSSRISRVSATVLAPDMPQHLGQFLVERAAPGVRIEPTWQALAMRESASHDIVFDDVFVPDEDVIRVSPSGEPFVASIEVAPWHGLTILRDVYRAWPSPRGTGSRVLRRRACRRTLGKPIGDMPAVRREARRDRSAAPGLPAADLRYGARLVEGGDRSASRRRWRW